MKEVKVMLVDDHATVRESLASFIDNRTGYLVCSQAQSGEEAIKILGKMKPDEYPDIVLMDLLMEKTEEKEPAGLYAARKIFSQFSKKGIFEIRVIILSSELSGLHITTAFDMKVQGYLAKESGTEEIFKAFDTVMKGDMYYRDKVSTEMSRYIQDVRWLNEQIIPPTAIEMKVLQLTAEGLTAAQISVKQKMSVAAVEGHKRFLLRKFNAQNVAELISLAYKHGYLPIY